MTLLSHLHETVTVNGVAFDLHTGRYTDGTLHPQGWHYVAGFDDLPVPTWRFDFPGGLRIVKRVFLAPGKNTVYISYERIGGTEVDLTLAPLVAWKDYHGEMRPWNGFPMRQGFCENGFEEQATPDAPVLRLLLPGAKWARANWWHSHNWHEREAERGQDAVEDLYCPATATISLSNTGEPVVFIGTIEADEPEPASVVLARIIQRQDELLAAASIASGDAAARQLVVVSDQFIVRGDHLRTTILAGYPWFTDWGRDTFIALPGLCLATGRPQVAREILLAFAEHVSEGMIPNRFPDAGETPDYNTVDATLWFIHACDAYVRATDDAEFRTRLAPILRDIIAHHDAGTRYGIRVDPEDGLLAAGQPGVQLTWMDAKIGDYVVTPRIGKPVEVNALWLHALTVVADFSGDETYRVRATAAAARFREKFVRPNGGGLYDCLAPSGAPDSAIRPNQIIAAALPTSPLTPDEARAVVDTVGRELLTPYGLRTLSPNDPAYRARYEGDARSRDSAYHQGTVWPWLLGPYADARRKVYGDGINLSELLASMTEYGVGGIAEVYDGSEPRRPNGCPWQAWSVAEVLRVHLGR